MLPNHDQPYCPECADLEQDEALDRREFIRVVGGQAAALVALGGAAAAAPKARASDRPAKPAEAMIRELYASLSSEQKAEAVLPWDHGAAKGIPTRLGMYNRPIGKRIGEVYTKPQQELLERILKAICSDEEGYRRISRNGNFDSSGSFDGIGATIFGEPADGKKFALVFAGHHLTVRCDGNSEEGAAFGGPMYYGHSPNGYSDRNVFFYQTKSVLSVFDALSEAQRKKAIVPGTPGEHAPSVRFRKPGEPHPGISIQELTRDQRQLVEKVMRDILSPYRKEDVDEVMEIIKVNGGMERIHLAFYEDANMNDNQRWHFWRLEGPGFVWNYRVLPHVHTYVNISSKLT
ncbi:MAG TPA: DUF3500 domain-containing protein [Gemmataceae bacterium]|nr:DUF3500 domain-containing protein [Gemmataceae bacterium]